MSGAPGAASNKGMNLTRSASATGTEALVGYPRCCAISYARAMVWEERSREASPYPDWAATCPGLSSMG